MSLKHIGLMANIEKYFRDSGYVVKRLSKPYKTTVEKKEKTDRNIKRYKARIELIPVGGNSIIIRVITKNSINRHIELEDNNGHITIEALSLIKGIVELNSRTK